MDKVAALGVTVVTISRGEPLLSIDNPVLRWSTAAPAAADPLFPRTGLPSSSDVRPKRSLPTSCIQACYSLGHSSPLAALILFRPSTREVRDLYIPVA